MMIKPDVMNRQASILQRGYTIKQNKEKAKLDEELMKEEWGETKKIVRDDKSIITKLNLNIESQMLKHKPSDLLKQME